jgi:prepilin-type processing-associated H-X9-DG protein
MVISRFLHKNGNNISYVDGGYRGFKKNALIVFLYALIIFFFSIARSACRYWASAEAEQSFVRL